MFTCQIPTVNWENVSPGKHLELLQRSGYCSGHCNKWKLIQLIQAIFKKAKTKIIRIRSGMREIRILVWETAKEFENKTTETKWRAKNRSFKWLKKWRLIELFFLKYSKYLLYIIIYGPVARSDRTSRIFQNESGISSWFFFLMFAVLTCCFYAKP